MLKTIKIARYFIWKYSNETTCFPGTELVGPSYRVLAGFLIQGFYSIGYMALSGVAYLIYDWRYIEVAITVPVVLFAAYLW